MTQSKLSGNLIKEQNEETAEKALSEISTKNDGCQDKTNMQMSGEYQL